MVAVVGIGASAFQIEPEVVTRVSTATSGLWIPVAGSGEIVHVDTNRGEVSARVAVSERGAELDVLEVEGGVLVVDRTGGVVSLVDPALHEVVRQVDTPVTGEADLVDIGPEGVVVAAGSEVGVVDVQVTRAAGYDLGDAATSVAASREAGVAATSSEVRVVDFEQSHDPREADEVRVVRAGDSVVILGDEGARELEDGGEACIAAPLGPDAQAIGESSGRVVVADQGVVQRIDLDTGTCASVEIGEEEMVFGLPAVTGGLAYVPEPATGRVHIVDLIRGNVSSHRVAFGETDLRVRSRDDLVVAYAGDTSLAAVLGPQGVVRAFDTRANKRSVGVVLGDQGLSAVLGEDGSVAVGLEGQEGEGEGDDALVVDAAVLAASVTNPEVEEPEVEEEPDEPTVDELVASFAVSAATVPVGTVVDFVDESTGSPESWVWDFGDGTGAEGPQVQHAWEEPGTFPVTLHITRGEETAEVTLVITVVPVDAPLPPSADFQVSSAVVKVGDSVSFQNRSTGDIERWHWDFGDGTSSDRPDVNKSWDQAGRYTVVLTVSNPQGSDSESIVIEVLENLRAPVAVVAASASTVEVGEPVVFTGVSTTDPAAFSWDFGDGRTGAGPSVTQIFSNVGVYTVTLVATNSAGRSEAQLDITVVPATLPPVARIATLPPVIEVGDVISFTSLSTNGPDTEEWSFGDGTTATGPTVTHTWSAPGNYNVNLTATNRAGSSTAVVAVEVLPELPPPVAVISGFNPSPWVGEATAFTDASLDATGWLWDFGDGSTSTSQNPLHTFSSTGEKTVSLTVTNRNGTSTTSVLVNPRLRPVADFSASNVAPRVGQAVSFTDLSVNAVSWSWDFGDGFTSSLQNPTHAYSASGAYSVVLTVTSATGDTDTTLPLTINVDPAPPAIAISAATPTTAVLGLVALSGEQLPSSGPISSWDWVITGTAGTVTVAGQNINHIFTDPGSYSLVLRATGPLDVVETAPQTITITLPAPPTVSITATPNPVTVGTPVDLLANTTGDVVSWEWDVDGGGYVAGTSVLTHTFTAVGSHTVWALVTDTHGQTGTGSVVVTVNPPAPPTVSVTATPNPVTLGTAVDFSATPSVPVSSYEWDFGAGYVAGNQLMSHTFATVGTHTVWVRVTDVHGQTGTNSVVVTVNPPAAPTVTAVVATPNPSTVGTVVGFAATTTGTITQWEWDYTGGGTAYVIGTSAGSHAFTTVGTHTVWVRVTDAYGQTGTGSVVVTVNPPAPPTVTAVVATPNPATAGNVVGFSLSTTGAITQWEWDYTSGVGSAYVIGTSSGSHTFSSAGSHTVWVRVTDAYGQTATGSVVVTVNLPPAPTVTAVVATPNPATAGAVVGFSATTTGAITQWEWDYTSGVGSAYVIGTSSGSYTFGAAGTYTVWVRVTDAYGQTGTGSVVVTVNP